MFKALTLLLLIGQSPNLWTHSGLVIQVGYRSILRFLVFILFIGLVFFQDIIMWGEGVY